ncbi:MAG: 16S rRNA (cytidine(1402)-2'-O)-methyltransferase [Candidatus Porifericomitaceae bacterium WSBS_2022_MAG_OTU9]
MTKQDSQISKHAVPQSGTLYIVATPIGNLDDLGTRAKDVLTSVDLVLAEDTRHSKKLLLHYGINRAMQPLHEHNERTRVESIVRQLLQGRSVALLSDAGTPLLNDPGFILVAAAHDAAIPVRSVPGPSALTAALSIAAMPTNKFCFEGFLPPRSGARRRALAALVAETRTMVFFEAPHRLRHFAVDAAQAFGAERKVAVVKEISKLHESVWRGSLGELQKWLGTGQPINGEFVVLLAGAQLATSDASEAQRVVRIIAGKLPPREAAVLAAKITGWSSKDLYDMVKATKT